MFAIIRALLSLNSLSFFSEGSEREDVYKRQLLLYNYVTKQKHTKEGVLNEELALKKLLRCV